MALNYMVKHTPESKSFHLKHMYISFKKKLAYNHVYL